MHCWLQAVLTALSVDGRDVVDISLDQMHHFAGNVLCLQRATAAVSGVCEVYVWCVCMHVRLCVIESTCASA